MDGMGDENSIVVAALAMLLALFFQSQIEKVGQTIIAQPFASGIGLLTSTSPFVLLILVITIPLTRLPCCVLLLMLSGCRTISWSEIGTIQIHKQI
jgi:hypothetical protein